MSARRTLTGRGHIAAVVSYKCSHGHAIPMSGVSLGGTPWHGLFCPDGECLPSWRDPADPWIVLRASVDPAEIRRRMESVRRAGVLDGAEPATEAATPLLLW